MRLLGVLVLIAGLWLVLLAKVGVWHATCQPSAGTLVYSYEAWERLPVTRHAFLAEYEPDDFARGVTYSHYSYPFMLGMFAVMAPGRYLGGLPWELAQNLAIYPNMLLYLLALVWPLRARLAELLLQTCPYRWLLGALSLGLVLTCPFPWLEELYRRDFTPNLLVAVAWCCLSVPVFHRRATLKQLGLAGLFLALWAPVQIVAWVAGAIYACCQWPPPPRWTRWMAALVGLAALQHFLPHLAALAVGWKPLGSSYFYRSGLDGSTRYLHQLPSALLDPYKARQWSLAFYLGLGAAATFLAARAFPERHPAAQAGFLLIPYATLLILFPQYVTNHSGSTDLLLGMPILYLMAFWTLQPELPRLFTGRSYCLWLGLVGLTLMNNLLTLAQCLRGLP